MFEQLLERESLLRPSPEGVSPLRYGINTMGTLLHATAGVYYPHYHIPMATHVCPVR
jgi:hypothetical protein